MFVISIVIFNNFSIQNLQNGDTKQKLAENKDEQIMDKDHREGFKQVMNAPGKFPVAMEKVEQKTVTLGDKEQKQEEIIDKDHREGLKQVINAPGKFPLEIEKVEQKAVIPHDKGSMKEEGVDQEHREGLKQVINAPINIVKDKMEKSNDHKTGKAPKLDSPTQDQEHREGHKQVINIPNVDINKQNQVVDPPLIDNDVKQPGDKNVDRERFEGEIDADKQNAQKKHPANSQQSRPLDQQQVDDPLKAQFGVPPGGAKQNKDANVLQAPGQMQNIQNMLERPADPGFAPKNDKNVEQQQTLPFLNKFQNIGNGENLNRLREKIKRHAKMPDM